MSASARVAVVTGATRRLGRGMAAALGRRGTAVAIVGQDAGDAPNVAGELSAAVPEGRFVGIGCDVRSVDEVVALAAAATIALGPIDLWVSNVGLALTGQTLDRLDPVGS